MTTKYHLIGENSVCVHVADSKREVCEWFRRYTRNGDWGGYEYFTLFAVTDEGMFEMIWEFFPDDYK